ncbi:MAG: hypothetical protein JW942_09330 [Opitutales bacterium]|nr:hypothetical protein [Opitutales bacterium]
MNQNVTSIQHTFVMQSGREFASGVAESDGVRVSIGHHVHIAGKEFEDTQDELKAHIGAAPAISQATMPMSIVPIEQGEGSEDVLAKLCRSVGVQQNNIAVAVINPVSGRSVAPGESLDGCVALGLGRTHVARRKAELVQLGILDAAIHCRVLNAIAAIKERMKMDVHPEPVLCASVLPASTQLFIVGAEGVRDMGFVDHGYANIMTQIMSLLNLKFEGSAARLFFGNVFDFDEYGECLAAPLAELVRAGLEGKGAGLPPRMLVSGLPPARARMLSRNVAAALGLEALELPVDVQAMDGAGLSTLPAVGAPSVLQMLRNASLPVEERSFFIDWTRADSSLDDYWKPAPATVPSPSEEAHAQDAETKPESQGRLRMYRGVVFGPDGQPVDTHSKEKAKDEAVPAEDSAKPAKDPAPRKILRYYRGTPIYADDEASAESEAAHPAKEVVHTYRGARISH